MVCNITTLFLSQQLNIKDESSRHYLRFFLISLTGAGMLAIILFLGLTSVDYLDIVYNKRAPSWFAVGVWVVTFGNMVLAIYFGFRSYLRRTALNHASHANGQTIKPANRLRVPTYLIVVYAGVGPFAAAAARYPDWPEKPITWVVFAYWTLGLIFPGAIVVWLADAVLPDKNQHNQHLNVRDTAPEHPPPIATSATAVFDPPKVDSPLTDENRSEDTE